MSDPNQWLYELDFHRLRESEDLQARVLEAVTGMTALHVACLCCNVEEVRKALREGAQVNDQIDINAPIFQGYTPLHCRVYTRDDAVSNWDVNDEILDILLKAGSNVTLQCTRFSKTVVHLALDLYINDACDIYISMAKMLLEATRNFKINPTSVDGLSHFELGCITGSLVIMQNLLKHNKIDVNRKLDCFSLYNCWADADSKMGQSALGLVVGKVFGGGISDILKILDLLLKYGANVHAEDDYGETPLHDCARSASLRLCMKLIREGADPNARNDSGETPLLIYLEWCSNITIDELLTLLTCGCSFNVHTNDGSGSVARVSQNLSHKNLLDLLSTVMIIFPQEMEADSDGRSILQNVLSAKEYKYTAEQYFELVEQISMYPSCDVDHQDKLGRTALHVAADSLNFKAICALLLAGADANIIDLQGKAAFSSRFLSAKNTNRNSEVVMCAIHLKKLKLCKIDVKRENEEFLQAFEKLNGEIALSNGFVEEIENSKNLKIKPHSLTVFGFLSETGAVADYPRMPLGKREDVEQFFSLSKEKLRKEFPEVAGIIALQWRKARARPQIVELAGNVLLEMTGLLPEICLHIILFLSNTDLKNLLAAQENVKTSADSTVC